MRVTTTRRSSSENVWSPKSYVISAGYYAGQAPWCLPLAPLLRPFLAKAQKGHLGIARGAAGPGAPVGLDDVHVPARGGGTGHVVDVRIKRRDVHRMGAVVAHGAAAANDELVFLVIDADLIIRHVPVFGVLLGDGHHQAAEFAQGRSRSAFLLQHLHRDAPFLLAAAMLARQFVDT